jgi:hypothetical protein
MPTTAFTPPAGCRSDQAGYEELVVSTPCLQGCGAREPFELALRVEQRGLAALEAHIRRHHQSHLVPDRLACGVGSAVYDWLRPKVGGLH